nr:MAG TPA: hypothetical protein [Bacteriophage sp.]
MVNFTKVFELFKIKTESYIILESPVVFKSIPFRNPPKCSKKLINLD